MPTPGISAAYARPVVNANHAAPVQDPVPLIRPDQFRATIAQGDVVVEFFNFGCPFCQHAEPHLKKVATELAGNVKFARMSLADPMAQYLAGQFGTTMLPGFAVFRGGKFVGSFGRQGRDHVEADFIRENVKFAFRAAGNN